MNTNHLKQISSHTDQIDKSKLPVFVQLTIDKFLKPKNPGSSDEYLALCALSMASYVLCFQRVKVGRTKRDTTFPNIYGVAFSPSGSYKDKPFDDMKNRIVDFLQDEVVELNESKGFAERKDLMEEALSIYGKTAKGEPKSACFSYVTNKQTNDLVTFFKNGTTTAGLLALREAYLVAKKGAPFLMIGELANMLKARNENDASMLNLVEELFNHGNNDAVVLKGNKKSKSIKDVPQVAWFHSSFEGILEDESVRKDLVTSLNRQMSRRSIFFFPEESNEKNTSEEISLEEIMEQQVSEDNADILAPSISKIYKDTYDYFSIDPESHHGDAVILLTDEARILYMAYRKWGELRQKNANPDLAIEIGGRHWKALKIAGIYAAFENPNYGCTKDNLEKAIYLLEFFGSHYKRLTEKRLDSFGAKIIDYLLNNGWSGKVKLKKQNFINHNFFSGAFAKELPMIEEECFSRGLMLLKRDYGTNSCQYNVIQVPEHYQAIADILKINDDEGSYLALRETYGDEAVDNYLKFNN